MRAGASGYLLRDTPARELVAAVRVIASGDAMGSTVTALAGRRIARRLGIGRPTHGLKEVAPE